MPIPYPPYRTLQDIPPEAARFCLMVERFCRELPGLALEGTSIIVAYSGGADSKALLFALHFLAPRLGITLHAATLDHGLRAESGKEVSEAAVVCKRLGIPFHTQRYDVGAFAAARSIGLEEAGRLARLKFFTTVRQSSGCSWVALGHQLNDLAEDSLMRLVRGGGWPAVAGMDAVSEDQCLFRPLLLRSRVEIEAFLRLLGEQWVADPMNEDPAYLRNRVRSAIVPLLLRENPAFLKTVADRWRMARGDAAFFAAAVKNVAREKRADGIFFSRHTLEATPLSVRLRAYMAVLATFGEGQVTATHLAALDAAWRKGDGGKKIQFSGRKTATVQEGGVLFHLPPVPEASH